MNNAPPFPQKVFSDPRCTIACFHLVSRQPEPYSTAPAALQVITRDQIRRFGASSFPEALRLADNLALRLIDQIHNNSGAAPGTVPSYAELDARVAWHATEHLELSLVGENLLHQRHPESGFPGPVQEWPSRSVYGKIAYQF